MNASQTNKTKNMSELNSSQEKPNNELSNVKLRLNKTFSDSKPPRMKKEEKLSGKIDELISNVNNLATKTDLNNNDIKDEISNKMMVQNSKIVEAISDTKEIAYNQGLEADITGTKQQVETLQLRLDSSNKHMNEITRENEAMNADFKLMGKTIEHNSRILTQNNRVIDELINKMSRGLTVKTTDVAYDVAENFKRLTGITIDELIDTNLSKQLAREYNNVQEASLNVQLLEASTRQSVDKLEESIHSFQKTFNLLFISLVVTIGLTQVIPFWWGKVIALIGSVLVIFKLNVWGDSDNED